MNDFWTKIFGEEIPTVLYCENAISGLIARPGYFISNLAYLIVGFWIFKNKNYFSKIIGSLSFLIGLSSAIYDASFKFNAQIIDLLAMFTLINFLFFFNVFKLKIFHKRTLLVMGITLEFAYFLGIYTLKGSSGRVLFGILIFLLILLEFYLFKKNPFWQKRYFFLALAFFIFGFLIWLLDANKIFCAPINYLNGRALYHYITAFSIYFLYKHNLQKI